MTLITAVGFDTIIATLIIFAEDEGLRTSLIGRGKAERNVVQPEKKKAKVRKEKILR